MLAWGRNEEAVVLWEKVVLMTQSVRDRETRFGGPGMLRTRATEGLEQRGETGATEGLGRTQQRALYARYTPKTYDLGHCPPSTAASECLSTAAGVRLKGTVERSSAGTVLVIHNDGCLRIGTVSLAVP